MLYSVIKVTKYDFLPCCITYLYIEKKNQFIYKPSMYQKKRELYLQCKSFYKIDNKRNER
jgi:hypothetical protein